MDDKMKISDDDVKLQFIQENIAIHLHRSICIISFSVYGVEIIGLHFISLVTGCRCCFFVAHFLFCQRHSGSSSDVVWFHSENDRYLNLSRVLCFYYLPFVLTQYATQFQVYTFCMSFVLHHVALDWNLHNRN